MRATGRLDAASRRCVVLRAEKATGFDLPSAVLAKARAGRRNAVIAIAGRSVGDTPAIRFVSVVHREKAFRSSQEAG